MKGNRKIIGFCLSLAALVILGYWGQDVGMAIAATFAAFAGGNAVEHMAGRE
jgi:hypothetical protein